MIDVFRGLKNLIKISHVHIDSTIFRLHYTFTVMCLLGKVWKMDFSESPIPARVEIYTCYHSVEIECNFLPFWFYVKSILIFGWFQKVKNDILIILQALDFGKKYLIANVKYSRWMKFQRC